MKKSSFLEFYEYYSSTAKVFSVKADGKAMVVSFKKQKFQLYLYALDSFTHRILFQSTEVNLISEVYSKD